MLAGEENVGVSGLRVDYLYRLADFLQDGLPLLFGEFERHERTLRRLTEVHRTTQASESPRDS